MLQQMYVLTYAIMPRCGKRHSVTGSSLAIACNAAGRYVAVGLSGKGILTLCEVTVDTMPSPEVSETIMVKREHSCPGERIPLGGYPTLQECSKAAERYDTDGKPF